MEDKLLRRLWITKATRFLAAEKFHYRHWHTLIAVNVASIVILLLGVAPRFFSSFSKLQNEIEFLSLIYSIGLMLLSFLATLLDYQTRSNRLHLNAMKVNELKVRADRAIVDGALSSEFAKIERDYASLLLECENQGDSDYRLLLWKERHFPANTEYLPKGIFLRSWYVTKVYFLYYWFHAFLVAIYALPTAFFCAYWFVIGSP